MTLKIRIMKTLIKHLASAIFAILISTSGFSQEVKQLMTNEKQIVFKLESYTNDTDKLLRKEFDGDKHLKIVYTCLQTGYVVFESNSSMTPAIKTEIQNRIKKVNEAIQFLHMQGFSLKEADDKCQKTKP